MKANTNGKSSRARCRGIDTGIYEKTEKGDVVNEESKRATDEEKIYSAKHKKKIEFEYARRMAHKLCPSKKRKCKNSLIETMKRLQRELYTST